MNFLSISHFQKLFFDITRGYIPIDVASAGKICGASSRVVLENPRTEWSFYRKISLWSIFQPAMFEDTCQSISNKNGVFWCWFQSSPECINQTWIEPSQPCLISRPTDQLVFSFEFTAISSRLDGARTRCIGDRWTWPRGSWPTLPASRQRWEKPWGTMVVPSPSGSVDGQNQAK